MASQHTSRIEVAKPLVRTGMTDRKRLSDDRKGGSNEHLSSPTREPSKSDLPEKANKLRRVKQGKERKPPSVDKPKTLLFYLPNHRKKSDGYYLVSSSEGSPPFRYCGPIDIIARTRGVDGFFWGLLVKWADPDGKVHLLAIQQSWLAGDGSELRAALLDRGFFISNSPKGRASFMELLSLSCVDARARAVSHVGWSDNAFVLPDRTIRDDYQSEIVIYQGVEALDHVYSVKGSLEDWQQQVAVYGPGNSRLILVIAAAFVGPLLSLLGEEGGGLNLRGPSSIGKSTVLFAAGSVWGSPTFIRQWRATSNAIEGICQQHNETLLCLDELAQLDEKEAKTVAYMIANGRGKARAGRSGQLKASASWLVFYLSTGEISLADHAGRDSKGAKRSAAGQEVRVLDIEADAGKGMGLFEELHDAPTPEALSRAIKEGTARVYGSAGPAFVERLCGDKDGHVAFAAELVASFVSEVVPANSDGQVSRGARRFALIAAAGELAIRLGVLPWSAGDARMASHSAFRQWLAGRGGIGSAEDRESIAKVRAFLEMHGSSRFEAIDSIDHEPRTFNRVGFWRDGESGREFLVTSEAWRTEVCAGMDANRVARVLAANGFLTKDSAGRNSITVTLPSGIGKTRCYVISSAIFDAEAEA